LRELGFPWIDGYKPLSNFQDALVDAIEARIAPAIEQFDRTAPTPPPSPDEIDAENVFVAPPLAPAIPKGRSKGNEGRYRHAILCQRK
jgi:hypothetical protein